MTSQSQRQHAPLAPSASHRWIACPGSVQLSEGLEEETSVFASEGTAAHELAAMCLEQGKDAAWFRGWVINSADGTMTAAGRKADGRTLFEVDADMVDGVQLYLEVVREVAAEATEIKYEQKLQTSIEGSWGTGDTVAYTAPKRRVTIVDFKYGRGVVVEVKRNPQLSIYADGVALRFHNYGIDEAELVIVQPRAPHPDGPVRRWLCPYDDLRKFVEATKLSAADALSDAPTFATGSHCKYCPAAGFCSLLANTVKELIDMGDPAKFTPKQLADAFGQAPLVAGWARSVEKLTNAEARRGNMPPGYKFVEQKAHRKFEDEDNAAGVLVLMGVSPDALFEPPVMKSPAQLEKELPRKARKVMATLTTNKSSRVLLVPKNDARPAVVVDASRGAEPLDIEEED